MVTCLEYFRRTGKVMDVFDGAEVEERELPHLAIQSVRGQDVVLKYEAHRRRSNSSWSSICSICRHSLRLFSRRTTAPRIMRM